MSELVLTVCVCAVGASLAYGLAEYLLGLTPAQRARGLDHIVNLMSTCVVYGCLLAIHTRLVDLVSRLGEVLGLHVPSGSLEELVSSAARFYSDLFRAVQDLEQLIFTICTLLSITPYTAPLAAYVGHATQYLQWMAHWALINCGVYRILAEIARYSRDMILIGLVLSIPDFTRPLGAVLGGLSITLPALVVLTYAWCERTGIMSAIPHELSIEDAIEAARTLVTGGYELGTKLQELSIVLDIALGLALLFAYGIARTIDRVSYVLRLR